MNVLRPILGAGRTDGLRHAGLGTLHGIGLGPGDPELVTMRAVRLIRQAPVLAYFAKAGRRGHARTIVDPWLEPGVEEVPLLYPVTTERHFSDPSYVRELSEFYEESGRALAARLSGGADVALVCEGDPLFYGSFMHLLMRLKDRFKVEVTAGITGMSGCWSAAAQPMTWGDDILTVLPATLDEADLARRLRQTDAAVIMKLGSNFAKARRAVEAAGHLERALYVERGTMSGELVQPLADKRDERSCYFSLILVPGEGRRP